MEKKTSSLRKENSPAGKNASLATSVILKKAPYWGSRENDLTRKEIEKKRGTENH